MSTSGWCVDLRGVNPESRGIASYATNLCNGLAEISDASDCQGFLADAPLSGWNDLKLSRVDRIARGLRLLPDLFVNRLVGGSYVGVIHDLIPLECRDLHWRSRKHKWLGVWSRWMRRRAAHAKALICVSHATASSVRTFWPELTNKITVIQEGIPSPTKDLEQPLGVSNSGFLLLVSRRDPHKNLTNAIKAWEKIEAPPLVIVSPNDPRYPEVLEAVSNSEKADKITILESVTQSELQWLYKNAALLLVPSLCEGFGLPAFEAARSGCPVVASPCGAIPEIFRGHFVEIDPKIVASIGSGIIRQLKERTVLSACKIPTIQHHAVQIQEFMDEQRNAHA